LERQRHDRRRRRGQDRVGPASDHRADADDDRDIDRGDEDGQRSEQKGAVDHHVDVEQPIPEHGDTDGDRYQAERRDGDRLQRR
jgi:hypothetical protein